MNDNVRTNQIASTLFDAVLKLALEPEEEEVSHGGDAPVPPALERRIRRRLRLCALRDAVRRHAKTAAAVLVCVLGVAAAFVLSQRAAADVPVWTLTSETDAYGQNLMISFETDRTPAKEGIITPLSAAAFLDGRERTASYRTEAAYLEEYALGVRYEQCLLTAGGVTVIPVSGRTVKNIVIGGRSAVLVFDRESAAILWQDGICSYLLTGPFTADDAMKTARLMTEK
ncbi:MAG: hypothetical protein IKQ92_09375 [Clostridia bacterium]|nr:hypothetical protein [Clostridia bacterium]